MRNDRLRGIARDGMKAAFLSAAACASLLLFMLGLRILFDLPEVPVGKFAEFLLGAALTFLASSGMCCVVWQSCGGRWGDDDA